MKKAIVILILISCSFSTSQDQSKQKMKDLKLELKKLIQENTLIHYHEKKGWMSEKQADEFLDQNRKAMRSLRDEMMDMKYGHHPKLEMARKEKK